jgi:hypothetical protein
MPIVANPPISPLMLIKTPISRRGIAMKKIRIMRGMLALVR